MKKHLFTLFAAAMVVAGVLSVGSVVGISNVGAWGCGGDYRPPSCDTTTVPPTTAPNTTEQSTTTVPDTIVSIPTTVPEITTTTTTSPPEVSENPPSIKRPPAQNIKLAG